MLRGGKVKKNVVLEMQKGVSSGLRMKSHESLYLIKKIYFVTRTFGFKNQKPRFKTNEDKN
jgi:hypothetical protein